MSPLLLADVPLDTAFSCQELFGPAAPVFVFDDEDEVLHAANNTDMGLASYVYTENFGRATRVTEGLEYSVVGLNSALPSVAYAPMAAGSTAGWGVKGRASEWKSSWSGSTSQLNCKGDFACPLSSVKTFG